MLAANTDGPESGGHVTRKRHDFTAEYCRKKNRNHPNDDVTGVRVPELSTALLVDTDRVEKNCVILS